MIPLISVVVALGFGLLFMGVLYPAWAFMFAQCLKVALNIMVGLIFVCNRAPFAHIYIREISAWHLAAYYAAVALIVFIPWRHLWRNWTTKPVEIFKWGGIDKRQRV